VRERQRQSEPERDRIRDNKSEGDKQTSKITRKREGVLPIQEHVPWDELNPVRSTNATAPLSGGDGIPGSPPHAAAPSTVTCRWERVLESVCVLVCLVLCVVQYDVTLHFIMMHSAILHTLHCTTL
jgi:hypothetical protein